MTANHREEKDIGIHRILRKIKIQIPERSFGKAIEGLRKARKQTCTFYPFKKIENNEVT